MHFTIYETYIPIGQSIMQKQKIISGSIALVLLVTQSFSNWIFFSTSEVEASGPVEENKLVAMFVEQKIYEGIKPNIQRYTIQYIQGRFERTKVLVFPVDTTKIQATDIQKILSNLYHGGEKDTPSTLIGTILVGDIPLPVIKKESYIFPSILPYTDIEKPLYIYDTDTKYFIPTNATPDNRQELVHGLIRFDTTAEYNTYFDKLKAYARDPKSFADQKFWFEDFNRQEKNFTDQNVPLYLKGQLFDEDLTYHRYSPVLFSLLQESNNKDALQVLQNVGSGLTQGLVNPNDEYASTTQKYVDSLGSWGNNLSSQATQGQQSLQQIGNGDDIPTLVMGQSINQQVKPYESIFSAEYGDFISKEIETSARWTGVNIGSHITKTSFVDQQTSRTLLTINTLLEQTLDKKINTDKWALDIPIPVVREKYKCILNIPDKIDIRQENFYFGKNAWDIKNASETTRFRGTYGNFTGTTKALGIGRGGSLFDSTDSALRGVGAAFGITNQQVSASRGYNSMKALQDADAYKYRREHCGTDNNGNYSFDTYVRGFRGGNTPTNIDGNTMKLKYDVWEQAFNPSYNRMIGGALFDIAGSRRTTTGNVKGINAIAANTYGRMIQVAPGPDTGPPGLGGQAADFPWCKLKTPIPSVVYDYFSIMANPSGKDIQVVGTTALTYNSSKTCDERFVYKPISSIVKHTSPTKEEIEAMNITTKDRPIDVKRFVSFQSYGGQNISLQYPNLYNVEVYKREGNSLILKSVDEIKQSIITYLQTKVDEYNTTLIGQNALITGYVAPRIGGFAKLAQVAPSASPIGRTYTSLPNNFFISVLGADTIAQIAQNLYIKNSGWPIRLPSNTVGNTIQGLEQQFSLGNKIYATVENNIVVGQTGIGVNTTGYEAGYINANGANTIASKTTPSMIENADNKRQIAKTATNELKTNSDKLQAIIDESCGISSDGTVPLLKRPKALTCRWKNLRKVSLKEAVKISYKNAQGPVLPLKQFEGTLATSYEDYVNKVLDGDSVTDSAVSSLSLELPTQKVIRGAQLPFSVIAKNKKGDEISNLLFPIKISTSTGELMTLGQAIPHFETTTPSEPTVLDTTTIDPSVSRVRLSVHGPIEINGTTGAFATEKEIILVNGSLQVLVNNAATNNIDVSLPDNGYNTVTAGIPSVNENILPTISLRLTDGNSQALTSPVTITSSKGLIKPGNISTTSEQTTAGVITRKQFTTQNLWTIEGGALNVKLLPSMIAGTDTITISIPGLPDRTINVNIGASSPYAVSVIDDAQNNSSVRFAVQDRWGNTIQKPQTIQYSIIGDATTNGVTQGNISVSGNTVLPLTYGSRGGIIYVYGSLVASGDNQPGYIRKDMPTRLRPTTGLNIVYLTLEGKDRGNINNNTAATIISSSPKTLSVTTELFSQGNTLPTLGVITKEGIVSQGNILSISSGGATRKNITINNSIIGYIDGNAPYSLSNIVIQNSNYKALPGWDGGSTNNQAFSIVEARGETPETKEQDLSPIRSYAGGVTVGEAQKQLFDDARVNYGDPFLQHMDATKITDISKDTTITLFRDDSKTIKKTMELDIDNDGRKDLVILYDDDTIRFMKQYGGTPPYRQLGNLMAVADGVQDMWIGDSDNNGLQDIFIRTKKNTLRVYQNRAGTFDVNGSPICIDVPSGNTSLKDVWQLFIEDMNKDNQSDIITYDVSGKIRIFYGGNKSGDGYYVSKNAAGCDAGRKGRNSSLTVATYGLQLTQNIPIYDDSLIRWQGLTLPDYAETDEENNDTVPASIAQSLPNPTNPTSMNIQGLINAGIPEVIRFSPTPYDHLPVYENPNSGDALAYIQLKYLTGGDIVDVSKTFAYGQGDKVIVTITMRAKQNTIATYAEQLRGPREIVKKDDGSISGFNSTNIPTASIIDWNIGNGFEFMIDNIPLSAGKSISFSYPVLYRPTQSTTIGIKDTNKDGWLDITTTPVDSCMPTSLTYVSNQGVTYSSTSETINTTYTSGLNQLQANLNTQLQSINTTSQNVASGHGNLSQVPGINQALETWDNIDLNNLSLNGNFNLNVLNSPALEKGIDDVVKGLCQGGGGGGGGGKGPPVPFNMAFLAPGDFNVFGCKVGSDKGLPVFFFPGTIYVAGAPVPFPYGLKGPGDGFYWAQGGNYPSMIRIYVAPTLTASLGTAICFGPYSAGINLPSPIKHIAGNCIVIAPKGGGGGDRPNQTAGHPNSNQASVNTSDAPRICSNPTQSAGRPTSPFTMSAYNGSKDLPTRPEPTTTPSLGVTQGTYLGVVNFDTQPYATQLSQQNADSVQLKGGKAFKLQIEGGNVKGLIKCIINKWLDNQIRYMINNLTNMSINVYLPDVSQLMQGFKNVRLDEINKIADGFKQNPAGGSTPAGSVLKNLVTKAEGEKSATSQSDVSELGSIINNPFNALSSWFEQVPLIKVSTKNVTVQVPYIYSEDLTRYTAQAEAYGKQLEKSLREWDYLIKDMTGKCDKEETPNRKEACNKQLASYIDISTKTQQLQRSIKSNISTLQAYKRFPLELQQWLTISQRYITEVTDTVQGISTDITSWLNTNATRFEKYVDAIILMVGAVKSWQALINFSVDWKSKCGKCKVDNYDYYSCTLSMLCPTLPILAIPPFRLPNIFVDLSHIRLGLDVVLPNIHFVPKTIALPTLPEIPAPPSINIDFTVGAGKAITGSPKIPTIPQIPAPPRLPELPSFIPSIDINLPTLPPAPKIPRISPAITSTLKVVSTIGKILCIVKSGIGLVGEKGVKTRIEQMTQRSRSVQPFDSLSITKIQPPLKGFDLRVDSYLNFELNFDVLYNMLDKLTAGINKKTNTLINGVTAGVNTISQGANDASQAAQGVVDKGNVSTQGILGTTVKEPDLVEPSVLRNDLQKEIAALKNSEYGSLYTNNITEVENILTTKSDVKPNITSITKATKALEGLLQRTTDTLEEHKNSIKTYDEFLKKINSSFLIDEDNNIEGDITASLFTANDAVIHTIKTAEHPTISYINLQKQNVDGFANALATHTPEELNMGIFDYNKLQRYFGKTQEKIQSIKGYISSEQTPQKNTVAQAVDTVQTIIAPTVQAAEAAPVAMTPSNTLDIWRDDHSVYTNQTTYIKKENDNTRFARYYDFEPISKYSDFASRVDEKGYISRYNSAFNVWNRYTPITSLEVVGQSNTTTNIRRKNGSQKAYVIMLTDTIYANHENNYSRAIDRKYALAYDSGFDIQNSFITLPGVGTKRVSDLLQTTIINTIAFDPTEEDIDIMLSLTGNKRSYAAIAPLVITTRGDVGDMTLGAARSAQETLGVQIRGDNTAPVANALVRDKRTGNIVGTGTTLSVPRNSEYDVIVQWTDDGVVIENEIMNRDGTSKVYNGDSAVLENINTTKKLNIIATAKDQSNNQGTQTITISFEDTKIEINTVSQQLDEREIGTTLSTTYPNGFVRFFNQRSSDPYLLTGNAQGQARSEFPTNPTTSLTGRVFFDTDTISLFSTNQERIARIEKKTGKIIVSPERQSRIKLSLDFTQNTPSVLIIDTQTQTTLFSLYLKSARLLSVDSKNGFTTKTLTDIVGTFAGGTCIQDSSQICVVYITTDGNIYSADNQKGRVGGTYIYDGGLRYSITIDGKEAGLVSFIPTPLE